MAPRAKDSDSEPVVIADAPPSEMDMLRMLVKQQGEQIAALLAAKTTTPTQDKAEAVVSSERRRFEAAIQGLPAEAPRWSIAVRAVRMGFYPNPERDGSRSTQHLRRLPPNDTGFTGDVFMLEKPEDYAPAPTGWMQLVTDAPMIPKDLPPTSVPNRVQDPLGVMGGAPQRRIES